MEIEVREEVRMIGCSSFRWSSSGLSATAKIKMLDVMVVPAVLSCLEKWTLNARNPVD